jgi:hypothetical protein
MESVVAGCLSWMILQLREIKISCDAMRFAIVTAEAFIAKLPRS